jgi:hypothetical protein
MGLNGAMVKDRRILVDAQRVSKTDQDGLR